MTKVYKYEVDLAMLPPGADGEDLIRFCSILEEIVRESDSVKSYDVKIVPTFFAINDGTFYGLVAFGWPLQKQWDQAIYRVFLQGNR